MLLILSFLSYLFVKNIFFHPALNTKNLKDKNIILISIDTLRADHLGTYGYYRNTSPFIDLLAQESIVFEQAFAASSYTLASHTSLFTGLYPKTHKVYIYHNSGIPKYKTKASLDAKYKTLAEHLSSIGYHTLWMTSPNNEHLDFNTSEGRGFQTNLSVSLMQASRFLKWLDNNPNKKFFAFFHTGYVHDPYYYRNNIGKGILYSPSFTDPNYTGSIIGTFNETFKKFKKKRQINLTVPTTEYYSYYYELKKFWWSFVNRENEKDMQQLKNLYDDCILYVDYHIGLLISYLKTKDLYKNTIIILVSDHGQPFGEHGHLVHHTVHKEVLHVPLIMYIPGFPSKKIKSQVSLIDIYPTILDLIGQNAPHQMDGRSFLPLIRGTQQKTHDYIFGSFYSDTSVSDGKWKLIRTKKGIKELYHISEDPYEEKEISEKYPYILKKLDQKIDEFLESNSK